MRPKTKFIWGIFVYIRQAGLSRLAKIKCLNCVLPASSPQLFYFCSNLTGCPTLIRFTLINVCQNEWKTGIERCIWGDCRHNKIREERGQPCIYGALGSRRESRGGGPVADNGAHSHSASTYKFLLASLFSVDLSGTLLSVKIQLWLLKR